MRVFVFFDLPTLTKSDLKEYRHFRKFLIKQGFIMMQESVYTKLTLNATAAKTVCNNVQKHAPKDGLVELLIVTEKQFANIKYIVGKAQNEYLDTTERLVYL